MDAYGAGGSLTTRKVSFTGKRLFVNADAQGGHLLVEILDENDEPIHPFTADRCVPMRDDATLKEIKWKGARDLSSLAGQPVRLKFHLKDARLFAFWVSPDASGASGGYVAAGGPGFDGVRDE